MARAIMIQGTASSCGKTTLATGLCRIFRQDGRRVAPFKAQNMALNSHVTQDGLEMGRAQAMQAEACGIAPDARMNPILLKPTDDRRSQVIVNGVPVADMDAAEYFSRKKEMALQVRLAYERLADGYDVMVIEGAGSPAEINLKDDDIVNMGMARMAAAPVLLAGDIDRGGVFASLAGTLLLLDDEEKALVRGIVINKFRGDPALLRPGLRMLEDRVRVPVLGVIPWLDLGLDDEDSLTERFNSRRAGVVDIAVIRLPRIANFTDFNALERIAGIGLRYVRSLREFGRPDLVIVPGSKHTMGDLLWLRRSGLAAAVRRHAGADGPVIGICGGYQMLGRHIADPHGMEGGGDMDGLGLLPCSTVFGREKTRLLTSGRLAQVGGIFAGLSGLNCRGYEIHMGGTDAADNLVHAGNVYGTYIHGLFDVREISGAIARALFAAKGLDGPETFDMEAFRQKEYDKLALILREHLDMRAVYAILERGITPAGTDHGTAPRCH